MPGYSDDNPYRYNSGSYPFKPIVALGLHCIATASLERFYFASYHKRPENRLGIQQVGGIGLV